jgi:hypothetical protein
MAWAEQFDAVVRSEGGEVGDAGHPLAEQGLSGQFETQTVPAVPGGGPGQGFGNWGGGSERDRGCVVGNTLDGGRGQRRWWQETWFRGGRQPRQGGDPEAKPSREVEAIRISGG